MSQEKLAKRISKPQSYVSKIETAERQINVVELAEWCAAIEVSLIEFIQKWQEKVQEAN